ncbi:L-lactate dehydrogenase A chain-like isoform X2 [Pristis pectinata]|uniref:L-lactate dehydrogenase A chain-like isoform X2 n=1 Tax=Pristis pectinata TaxID=685728 RepID=UPI00223D65CE|nr:L-lactate dehydrogenase A chain-like isoform X2 [Pristis pectinata]
MSLRDNLLKEVAPSLSVKPSSKISIVGTGEVGMSSAICILQKSLADELVLVDKRADKVRGESMDLLHGSLFLKSKITSDTDCKATQDSKICIICAGVRMKDGRPDKNLLQDNIAVFKEVIPQVAKHSPNAILLIVTQPVDLLTYVAWKLSGFPRTRVIGTGTNLDTARFRYLLGAKLKVNPVNVHTYIIGEQGSGSVPVWSSTNVAGINLNDLVRDISKEHVNEIHKRVIDSGHEVIRLKGSISWAIGLSVANIVDAILKNLKCIQLVSTNAKGEHNIKADVFLSLPCVLGATGVCGIIKQQLEEDEARKLRSGVENLLKAQQEIVL